jgi:leucyl aminopeptidase (aminopeptidase T)
MKDDITLSKAAYVALKDYMGLQLDETLLVISDENLRKIGLALFETGKSLASEAFYMEMKAREINGEEPPDQIASMMKKVDVVVCPTTKSLTHTDARRRASELGVRVGTMPGITEDTMLRCFTADYKKIVTLSNALAERMEKTVNVRVITKLGTDVTMQIKKRKVFSSTGVLRMIGESGNLPSGEVYVAPWEGKTNGVVVFDASFAGIGMIDEPIVIEIKEGFAKKISGGADAQTLINMLDKAGKNAYAVAEFGIGTNYKAKIIGEILEDEKVKGTIHIAFGNNISMGGKINVKSHIDGLVKRPTVFFDNEMIMDNGRFLLKEGRTREKKSDADIPDFGEELF